jgi:hypothetical protein
MSSFGWFPGVWFIIADVSEHFICSIFLECSETSAIINQTPGNHPKEDILYSKHGESLKSRTLYSVPFSLLGNHLGFVLRVRSACRLSACISRLRWKDFPEIWCGDLVLTVLTALYVAQQIQGIITFTWQCFPYLLHYWQRQSVATVVKRTRNNVTHRANWQYAQQCYASCQLTLFGYSDRGFSVVFPQL